MANATVAQAVNRQTVALALQEARAKCAASHRWLNAVNRAALNLEAVRWQFDGDTLRVESATNSGDFYTVTVEVCPCSAGKAGKPCWHRAGVRLLCKAAEMGQEAPSIGVTIRARITALSHSKPASRPARPARRWKSSRQPLMNSLVREGATMGRYQTELLDLAKEIAAVEGIPLAAALERATVELRGLVVYAHDWNQHAAEAQWALIAVAQTA